MHLDREDLRAIVDVLRSEVRNAVREGFKEEMEDTFGDLAELQKDLAYLRSWRLRMEALDKGFWSALGRYILFVVLAAVAAILAVKGGQK